MPRESIQDSLLRGYGTHIMLREAAWTEGEDLEAQNQQLLLDLLILQTIKSTRYFNPRPPVPKSGSLHLAWEYAKDVQFHGRFQHLLRVSPLVFNVICELIKDHSVFHNDSNNSQIPIEYQLAITMYRMGRFGNAACLEDVATFSGVAEGTVKLCTRRCFTAIEALHARFVRALSAEEKEVEKQWIDAQVGFQNSLWREGWVMYDGTIVVLYAAPRFNGHAYYTRKGNYGLNLQVGNVPSTLRIVDYSHGHTGSVHDATAFESTAASMHAEWFFSGEEFAWTDSAYTLNSRTIAVHKKPASLQSANIIFDNMVSHLRIRSEHCMGALKGRFQCLRGLRVNINTEDDHIQACQWITIAIILHNIVIDVEGIGEDALKELQAELGNNIEELDTGTHAEDESLELAEGEQKRRRLTAELLAFRASQN